jgi:hypothetical protein
VLDGDLAVLGHHPLDQELNQSHFLLEGQAVQTFPYLGAESGHLPIDLFSAGRLFPQRP